MRGCAAHVRWSAAFALILWAMLLSGCVYSETITEVILNNDEDSKVDPSITPVLVNTPTATETSENLPKLDDDDLGAATESQPVTPYYTTDESKVTTDVLAPRPVYAKNVDPAGETAAQARDEAESDATQDGDVTDEEQPEEGARNEKHEKGREDSADEEEPAEDTPPTDEGVEGEGEGQGIDAGESQGREDDPAEAPAETPGEGDGRGVVYTSDVDEEPDIPEDVDEVAAIGNYAVIASMIGGSSEKTALVACDQTTKEKTEDLLAKRGMPGVTALWKNDGSSAGDLSDDDMDTLVNELKPDLVFVPEGSATLSENQVSVLQDGGIDIYYLPKLTSAKRIRFAVRVVGMTLAKGGVAGAEDAYNAYLDYESELVGRFTDGDHNGGISGGYDLSAEKDAEAADTAMATLFIDKWDVDARFKQSVLDTSGGVAVATLGYKAAPVSYYMSVGGALNNAASKTFRSLSGSGVVWQFAQNQLSYRFGAWTNLDVATYDLCSRIGGGVYISDLLWNDNELKAGYGTENFPAVVAKSQALQERMEANAQKDSQLYYAYPVIHPAAGLGTTIGFFLTAEEEDSYKEACIGRANDGRLLEAAAPDHCQVLVNPKGLAQEDADDALCSWTDGSVESVLEASWVYWKFRGGSEGDFKKDVTDFYKNFYGYDLTDGDYKGIVGGAAE